MAGKRHVRNYCDPSPIFIIIWVTNQSSMYLLLYSQNLSFATAQLQAQLFAIHHRLQDKRFRLQASGLVFQVPKQKISWSLQLTKVKEKYKLHVFIICDHLMLAEQQYWLQSKMKDGNHSYHQNPGALILPPFKHLTTFYDYMYVSWSFCTASSFFLYN